MALVAIERKVFISNEAKRNRNFMEIFHLAMHRVVDSTDILNWVERECEKNAITLKSMCDEIALHVVVVVVFWTWYTILENFDDSHNHDSEWEGSPCK